MPGPEVCDQIEDSATRERCKNYEGEFAKQKINKGMNNIDLLGDMDFDEESIISPSDMGDMY